jgi:hypothetical protein
MTTHLFIPDTQCRPGVPAYHLEWAGQYIVDRKPDKIIHAGDHWDLPSVSAWDKGKSAAKFQGRDYDRDVEAGRQGLDLLFAALHRYNTQRRENKKRLYQPEMYMTLGNHENRIDRYVETKGELETRLGTFEFVEICESHGMKALPFLEPLWLDGVAYSHYWYNPNSGTPIGGGIDNRLNKLKHSFTQGHEQTLLWGRHYIASRPICGLVAGAFYLHDEDYKGPQGNDHWRGLVVKHEVQDGAYDPMFVSMNYLCKTYEGVSLKRFMRKIFPVAA